MKGAKGLGFVFTARTPGSVIMEAVSVGLRHGMRCVILFSVEFFLFVCVFQRGKEKSFELLNVLEFSR